MATTVPERKPTGADRPRRRVVVVLDDDPTGTQAAADVPVVLDAGRVAVLATTRETPGADSSLDERGRVATALADVVGGVADRIDAVVTKGGVTSAVTVRHGLGAATARVVGPVAPGVALWDVPRPGRPLPVAAFPGNVGDDDALADLVALLLGRTP